MTSVRLRNPTQVRSGMWWWASYNEGRASICSMCRLQGCSHNLALCVARDISSAMYTMRRRLYGMMAMEGTMKDERCGVATSAYHRHCHRTVRKRAKSRQSWLCNRSEPSELIPAFVAWTGAVSCSDKGSTKDGVYNCNDRRTQQDSLWLYDAKLLSFSTHILHSAYSYWT